MLDTDARISFSHGQFGGGVEKLGVVMGEAFCWSRAEMLGFAASRAIGPAFCEAPATGRR